MDPKEVLVMSFLLAIVESVRSQGPEKTIAWIESIASTFGDLEGAGLEGDPMGGVNVLHICPFFSVVQEFVEEFGEEPEEFRVLIEMRKNLAVSNIFCLFHHRLRARRAEMAGKKTTLLLASDANPAGATVYNDDAIVSAGLGRAEVDEMMKKVACIFKFQ
jgi:hypothetical protein